MRLERFELHPHLRAAFTGRAEGNQATHTAAQDPGEVERARAFVASEVGLDRDALRYMVQVHSPRLAPVAQPGQAPPTADALMDRSGALAPVVLTADCVPVLIAASLSGGPTALVAAHAGRAGLLDGVLQASVDGLLAAGATELEAWIGPSICGACYEVPASLQEQSEARMPGISARTSWGTPSLDLPGASARLLAELGVLVHQSAECTLEQSDWFSYRGGDTKHRNASLLWDASLARGAQHASTT